jgi:hypothetical protein
MVLYHVEPAMGIPAVACAEAYVAAVEAATAANGEGAN